MDVAAHLAKICERISYFEGPDKNFSQDTFRGARHFHVYPGKESKFIALGGLQEFDITVIPPSPIEEALLHEDLFEKGNHPRATVPGAALVIGFAVAARNGQLDLKKLSPEAAAVAYVTRAIFQGLARDRVPIERIPNEILKKWLKGAPLFEPIIERVRHQWMNYIEYRYGDTEGPIRLDPFGVKVGTMIFPSVRNTLYNDPPWATKGLAENLTLIAVFDAVLDAGPNFEKLLRYIVLLDRHDPGAGYLAGALYGCLYGFKGVPKRWRF